MSDLQPRGIAFEVGGVERHFLFTLAAVDEIQAKYELPVSQVITRLADDEQVYQTIAVLTTILINDEIRRTGSGEKEVTEQEIKWVLDVPAADRLVGVLLKAYGYALPEDEDQDPNGERSRSS